MLVENQYAKAGTHHPSFSISIRQCLIPQKTYRVRSFVADAGQGGHNGVLACDICVVIELPVDLTHLLGGVVEAWEDVLQDDHGT